MTTAVGETFGGATERRDGEIGAIGVRTRAASASRRSGRGLQRRQRLELLDGIIPPPQAPVDARQRLASRRERRRQADGALQRGEGITRAVVGLEAKPQQVVALGEPIVQRQRALQWRNRGRGLIVLIAGERELVEHLRRSVVEHDVCRVSLGGAVEPAERTLHVAGLLERSRGAGVELARLSKVSQGGA